jgi:hypothetical protein
MPEIQLMGGEQDGHTVTTNTENCPEVFYAVPLADAELIRTTKGNLKKLTLRDKLATLAYRFDRVIATEGRVELRYVRDPSMDKKRSSL